jgi:uroporphyrinogen III methyltransferase/synthase
VNDIPPLLVSLVGAGPGHPGLLTLRAVELLNQADLVIFDKLVPQALLQHARVGARLVCVAELNANHPADRQPVLEAMIDGARAGQRVVRLKGGDPSIFGRGGEEAEALRRAGVACEIIPGVTAALGAAAFAGIPLTHRNYSSAVAFVTGHENPEKPETSLDWAALAKFPGTLVIYMGMSRLDRIVEHLIQLGKDPATPAAAVQWATLGDQNTLTATLRELPETVRLSGMTAPALVILGAVVELRERLQWFESLPLHGQRILITRPRQQGEDFAHRIVAYGGVPYLLPTVEIRDPDDWRPVDRALRALASYHWLVFTSSNGVRAFFERLLAIGLDLRAVGHLKFAAIGPKTAEALRRYHLEPDVVPPRFQSEDLAAALAHRLLPGERVLLARADRGRDVLRESLAGTHAVEQVAVYSQTDALIDGAALLKHLRRGEVDFITLTSTNIARVLLTMVDETTRGRIREGEIGLVSISPVTSEEIRRHDLPVAGEAVEATMEGVLDALVTLARAKKAIASASED